MMKRSIITFLFLTTAFAASCKAPVVKNLVWGTITVTDKGKDIKYKDCKLSPAGSSTWNWKKTGTEHVPGIQVADLEDFINQVDIVILSKGMHGVLQTKPDTLTYLKKKKKKFHQLLSPEAVELYNKLVGQGKKVGALIHSTC